MISEIGFAQPCARKRCTTEIDATEICIAEVRTAEICPRYVRSRKKSASEVCVAQICIAQDGLAQVRITENRCFEDRPIEVGAAQVGTAQIRLAEVGTAQERLSEVCTTEVCADHTYSTQVHPSEGGSSEICTGEIELDSVMFLSPLVPGFYSLLKQMTMRWFSHIFSVLSFGRQIYNWGSTCCNISYACHVVSKRIVRSHHHSLIGLEDLTHIRERTERKKGKQATKKQRKAYAVHSNQTTKPKLHASNALQSCGGVQRQAHVFST